MCHYCCPIRRPSLNRHRRKHNSQFQLSLLLCLLLLSFHEYLLQLLESLFICAIPFFGWQIIVVSALIQLVWVGFFSFHLKFPFVICLISFSFRSSGNSHRKFTLEREKQTQTNTQNMRVDSDAAEAATAIPSQLEVTPAPDKRK